MAIDLPSFPSEGLPLLSERLQVEHLLDRPEALDLVVVDDCDEGVQSMMRREQRGFPRRAFIAFAIAQEREYAKQSSVSPPRQRHAARDGQPVTQRTGRDLDAREAPAGHVARHTSTVLV